VGKRKTTEKGKVHKVSPASCKASLCTNSLFGANKLYSPESIIKKMKRTAAVAHAVRLHLYHSNQVLLEEGGKDDKGLP
jgi:hypothetical protein